MDEIHLNSVSPNYGFLIQGTQVVLKGTNFMNLFRSTIKLEFMNTGIVQVIDKDFLWLDSTTILFEIPSSTNTPFYNDRRLKISVSNNGVNYSPENIIF